MAHSIMPSSVAVGMAQRAIRDGRELDYGTYLEYGEWVNTPEIIAAGCSNQSTIESWAPDYRIHITMCPWYAQFKEMGLTDAGHVYCAHLDNSICRGFNPYLTYLVPETLHKSGFCTHIIKDVNFAVGKTTPKRPSTSRALTTIADTPTGRTARWLPPSSAPRERRSAPRS